MSPRDASSADTENCEQPESAQTGGIPEIEISAAAPPDNAYEEVPFNQLSERTYSHRGRDLSIDGTAESQTIIDDDEATSDKFLGKRHKNRQRSDVSSGVSGKQPQAYKSMHRYVLYETATRFYLIGQDLLERNFRVLKIDRTSPPGFLNIFEDENVYDRQSINELLTTIEDGNKSSGGFKIKCSCWGILGFIRFTEAYYMSLITKRTQAAMIGGHYVYQVEATELVPLTTGSTSRFQRDRNPEEARYLGILQNLDLTKFFYFSYSYNITRTLQDNICRQRKDVREDVDPRPREWNDMFVWNHHLLVPAQGVLKNPYDWCLPVIHGFVEQSSLDVLGRPIYLTIVARRSRVFAGARYLKRGANDRGYVANDVETEQIVSNAVTTSFHAPGPALFANPSYTSYVQHRGSIPLHWSQDNSGVTPKPDIDINPIDPFYSAAAMHFDDLFKRYGAPVYVLNLIKARERTPRESKLLQEFQRAIAFLNQSLPDDKKILYKAFDMSRAAKTRGQDVVGVLELIAEDIMQATDLFHNGNFEDHPPRMQNGVARTNCIDCLDRTNAAQFVLGKRALGHQLEALGIITGHSLEYDSDLVNIFTHMFHSHGDTIAIQYGGSHLAHTLSTYRKLNEWKNHSRDMVESFKRYYHNSFLDSQRQEAYNLFLGNYVYDPDRPMLWDLTSDHCLHYRDPRERRSDKIEPHYIDWYHPEHLMVRRLPVCDDSKEAKDHGKGIDDVDNYWQEYYRPLNISSLGKLFAWKLSSKARYVNDHATNPETIRNPSPFVPRKIPHLELPDSPGRKSRRGQHVTIIEPMSDESRSARSQLSRRRGTDSLDLPNSSGLARQEAVQLPTDRSQWSFKQWWDNSLNPSVNEEDEYAAYINHPLNLPLVTRSDPDSGDEAHADFAAYVSRGTGASRTKAHSKETNGDLALDIDEENLADFNEFLAMMDNQNPLTVTDDDRNRKRYKAYRQWLRGKSFFKQSKVDPEYKAS